MKIRTIKYLAMVAVATSLIFTSCKDDDPIIEPDAPTVTIVGVDANSVNVNFAAIDNHIYNVEFSVEVDIPGEIASFKMIRKKLNGTTEIDEDLFDYTQDFANMTSVTMPFSGSLDFEHFVNEDFDIVKFHFIAEDKNGKVGDVEFVVNDATVFPQTQEGAFFHIAGPDHGTYNLEADETVGAAEEDVTKKFIVNTDVTLEGFAGSWKSTEPDGNGTLFLKSNAYNFDDGAVREARILFNAEQASTVVEDPAVNDVFIAKYADKFYVIKVIEIDAEGLGPVGETRETVNNKGKLTFSYKKY